MSDRIIVSRLNNRGKEWFVNMIDSMHFRKVEQYHFGASLMVQLRDFNEKKYSYKSLWCFPAFGDSYHVRGESGQVMFLLSNLYKGRHDFEMWFLRIADLLKNKVIMLPKEEEQKTFSIQEKIRMGFWILQMCRLRLSLKEKFFCANLIMSGKRNLDKVIEAIEKGQVRSVITMADVHLADYMVTAYCNKRGIKTATLQHGFFSADDAFFHYSESDFFLSYSQYTKQLAETYRKRRGIFIAIGMPDFVGEKKPDVRKKSDSQRKRFLVLLNGALSKEQKDNISMLTLCKEYAEKNDCLFDVKPHPADKNLGEYRTIISGRGKFVASKFNITEQFAQYDFCVANVTTMALKAVYVLTPILLFRNKGEKSYFGLEDSRLNFSDYVEMKQGVSYIQENDVQNELIRIREFLCGEGDITNNYKEFLKEL